MSTWSTLLRFTKGVRRHFIFSVLAAIVYIFFNFLSPQIIKITIDSVIGTEPISAPSFVINIIEGWGGRDFLRDNIALCAAGIAICALVFSVFNYISKNFNATFSETYVKNMRDTLYNHVQHLPFSWHVSNQTGDIIQRCTSDVDVVRNFVANQLIQVVRTTIIIIVSLALMLSMNVRLSLVAIVFIPIVISYSFFFFSAIARKFRLADEAEGELTVAVQENLTGVRVVRAFGREKYELEKFDRKNEHYANLWINLSGTMGAYWGSGDLVTGAQVLTVMIFGAILASKGQLTPGEFLTFVTYTSMLAWPVRALGRVLTDVSKMRVSIDRIREILNAEPEPAQPDAVTPDIRQDIVFDNVTFGYTETPVLKDISFTIPFGSVFGILGSTGSGKSTITYLLNRLYDLPQGSGNISIGGVDLRDIDREYLRRNVGVVLQEPFLFSKTIRENIAITRPRAAIEEVRGKAAVAAVDDNIMEFGKGYETVVGERGVTLSGGQKQRVAIARTLMMDAPIMVFDDSMSAVDLETDAQIRESLRSSTDKNTVILISHRINTLMQADYILVLEDGKIAQFGSPKALLEQDGVYRRIYEMQSQAAAGNVPGAGEVE